MAGVYPLRLPHGVNRTVPVLIYILNDLGVFTDLLIRCTTQGFCVNNNLPFGPLAVCYEQALMETQEFLRGRGSGLQILPPLLLC